MTSEPDPADLGHYDLLSVFRDRFFGLRCAIKGADIAGTADRNGLIQLAGDLAQNLAELCTGFATERGITAVKKVST
jgi:hypothetical protein